MMYVVRALHTKAATRLVFKTRLSTNAYNQVAGRTINITASDNTELQATVFKPCYDRPLKSAVLLAPATGIQRHFYSNFSQWLSTHGHAVLTFDNRGIGDSLRGHIKACDASIVDWGSLDMPAAWSELQKQFPEADVYHILGHSAGGQVIGLMENAIDGNGDTTITSIFNVACSSGCLNNMDLIFGVKAKWFLNMFIPCNNFVFGYSRTDLLGMGGPLPYHVGRQWNEWCSGHGYVKNAFGVEVCRHWYDEVSCPSMWIHSIDDGIANQANIQDMLSVHSEEFQEDAKIVTLHPKDYGLKEIGHMGFFSSKNMVLWDVALQWFESFARRDGTQL